MHVLHVSSVTFIIYPIDICQMSAAVNTMQNINILFFVRSLSTREREFIQP